MQFDSPISTVLLFPLSSSPKSSRLNTEESKSTDRLLSISSAMWLVMTLLCSRGRNWGLQPVDHQHDWDGSGVQVSVRPHWESPPARRSWTLVCLCVSETSRSEVCPVPPVSQRVISGTPFFVRWSSTWILTDRRKCCWERMDRSVHSYGWTSQWEQSSLITVQSLEWSNCIEDWSFLSLDIWLINC